MSDIFKIDLIKRLRHSERIANYLVRIEMSADNGRVMCIGDTVEIIRDNNLKPFDDYLPLPLYTSRKGILLSGSDSGHGLQWYENCRFKKIAYGSGEVNLTRMVLTEKNIYREEDNLKLKNVQRPPDTYNPF